MTEISVEYDNKNLAIEDEIVNSDNPEVETVSISDIELETNSDDDEVDTSANGDPEAEIVTSDHAEDETVSSDDAEDETSASEESEQEPVRSDTGEDENVSNYDTELETNSDDDEVEAAKNDSAEFSLPEGVTPEPRNEEELHLDIFKDNPEGILTYLPVSDDNGEVLGDTELEQQVKTFCRQYSNLAADEIKDVSKVIEEAKTLATRYTLQTNKAENIFSGTTTKYRIRGGILWNITKTLVKAEGYEWVTWFKKNFGGREFRTVQDYMRLAKIPGIIRYAFLGKERLIQVAIYLKEFGAETDDPVGGFFKKYIVFNPEEEIDVQEFKIKTDIAINRQRCIKAGLDEITVDMIESIVRNGKDVESKQVKELQVRKDAGQDIAADFKKIIASDKKLKPFMTPQRQAEWFKNAANRFINVVEDAIKKPEYRSQLDVALITKLKGIVLELEQQVQANTQHPVDESTDTRSLTTN